MIDQPSMSQPASFPLASRNAEVGKFHQYRGFVLVCLGILTVWINLSFIKPLVMGAIFAVVLFPLMRRLRRFKFQPIAAAATLTGGFLITILLPVGIIGALGSEAALAKLQNIDATSFSNADFKPSRILETLHLGPFTNWLTDVSPITEPQIQQYAARSIIAVQGFGGRVLTDVVTGLPAMLFSNIIILFTLFFLLLDGPSAIGFIRRNSVFGSQATDQVFSVTKALCHSVLVSSIATGAVQGVIVGVTCLITRTPSVILFSFLTFLTSFVPVVGTFLVTLGLAGHAFFIGDYAVGITFLIAIAVIGLAENIVRPYVLKGGAELHPLIGFVAAFGALDTLGFYGLFIGPVVAGLFFALIPMVTRTYPRTPRISSRF
jgi:predicted PurR-regulated permease PerM